MSIVIIVHLSIEKMNIWVQWIKEGIIIYHMRYTKSACEMRHMINIQYQYGST